MRYFLHLVSLFFVTLIPLGLWSAETHRVLVVSATSDRISGEPCELRVVEIESGRVLARVEVGGTAVAAMTGAGDLMAVISHYDVARVSERHRRLEIFRTADLSLVQRGIVPVRINSYKQTPSRAMAQFSPDGKELVVQREESFRGVNRQAVLTRLQLELDDAGMFKIAGEPCKVAESRSFVFVPIVDWPRIAVWNYSGLALEVLDLRANLVLSTLPLGGSPGANVVTSDGKHAYYVPHHQSQATSGRQVGFLHKVDLTADPPKVVRTSDEPQLNLKAGVATVSETAGTLYVAEFKLKPDGAGILPSPLVKTFHTQTLAPAADINLSLTDCDCLAASHDGKYLYAVDFAGGMSVVDVATGNELKVLRDVGAHPALVLALP